MKNYNKIIKLVFLLIVVCIQAKTAYANGISTTTFNNYEVFNTSYAVFNIRWLAQYIVPTRNVYLGRGSFLIRNSTTTPLDDNITIEIRENNDATFKPKINVFGNLASKTLNAPATYYHWQDFDFDKPPLLLAGVTYWLCAENNESSKWTGYGWAGDITASTGTARVSLDQGASWFAIGEGTHTLCYRVYEIKTVLNTEPYTITADDGETKIRLDPMPFGNNRYHIVIDTDPAITGQISAANAKAENSKDSFFMPFSGTLRDIRIYKGNPLALSHESFSSDVEITIPYQTEGGYVKGTSPPVREETLAVYWLNEDDSIWVRIPGSEVNTTLKTVTAGVNHFSVFTLMGISDTDLSGAYAYPVPFRAGSHTSIKFKGLSSQATIRVYTITGELVQTIVEDDGDGFNDTLDVNSLASGVYTYYIYNDEENKTGQLVIIK